MRSAGVERSRNIRRTAIGVGLLVSALSAPGQPMAAPRRADPSASAPSIPTGAQRARQIEAAVARMRADPDIGAQHKMHVLRWKPASAPDESPSPPGSLAWLRSLLNFIDDSSRLLLYGMAIVLVALLAVKLRQLAQLRTRHRLPPEPAAVSHVRDLDVRPQSLPEDIAAVSWQLWREGRVGEALSLLYRGALSRLIHRDALPIGASTTEGECLVLARDRLEAARLRYLTRLVHAREASTYGGRALSPVMGEALCQGFASQFDRAEPAP